MTKAKNGDIVKIHYTGKLQDGTVFDSSTGREPLEFKIGGKQVIKGFEKAIIDMKPDDSKTVTIPPNEAYGPYREEMIADVPRQQFPPSVQPEVGQHFEIKQENGEVIVVTVIKVSESEVTIDANHPLAGKDLIFDLLLVEIV